MNEQISKRQFNPVLALSGVAAGIALIAAVLWTLKSSQPQPPGGLAIQITPAQTQAAVWATPATPTTLVEQTRPGASKEPTSQAQAATPAPRSTNTLQPTAAPPTPTPTTRAAPAFSGLHTEQIVVADVDLNCDGLPERVVKTQTYSSYHYNTSGKLVPYGIVAVGIQVPTQRGYQQAWEYVCELNEHGGPMCNSVLVNLIPAGQCEQFITFNGIFSLEGGWRLKIFRWNGQEGLLVLNEPAVGFESTPDPLVVTTMLGESQVSYAWNGAEFVQE